MACVFILAHKFIDFLNEQEKGEGPDVEKILSNMDKLFNKGNFKKPFSGLKKLIHLPQ